MSSDFCLFNAELKTSAYNRILYILQVWTLLNTVFLSNLVLLFMLGELSVNFTSRFMDSSQNVSCN